MVIELHIKVLQVLNAQGKHWVPIGIATKRVLCQSLQMVLCCYFSPSPPSFPSLHLRLCHVCLWRFAVDSNVHVTSRDEATLCQVVVADCILPPILYSPFPAQHFCFCRIKQEPTCLGNVPYTSAPAKFTVRVLMLRRIMSLFYTLSLSGLAR